MTPPPNVTIAATEAAGARGSASVALAAFLAAGSAVDAVDPAPGRLPPMAGTIVVDGSFLFPVGTTTVVTFRFADATGNLGTATATVEVVRGVPAITGQVVGLGVHSGRVFFLDVRLSNTGTGFAQAVKIARLAFRTTSGRGFVTNVTALSPPLPYLVGSLDVGASATVRFYVKIPLAVKSFTITESGSLKTVRNVIRKFSTVQTVNVSPSGSLEVSWVEVAGTPARDVQRRPDQ